MPIHRTFRAAVSSLCYGLTERDSRNALYIWATTMIGTLVLASTAIYDFIGGTAWLGAVKIVIIPLGLLNLFILHWWRNVSLAEDVLLVLLLALLVATFYGSIVSTGPYWLPVLPAIAFFLKGARGGLFWSAGMVCLVLLLGVLHASGLVRSPIPVPALVWLCLSLAVLTVLLAMSQSILLEAEAHLEQRTAQLGQEVLERLSVEQTLRRTEEKLRFMAHRDVLTGLPTRALFYDRLEQARSLGERVGLKLGLLTLDIRHFGTVNRRYGHAVGDKLLVQAAARLREALAPIDSVARAGGDEFAVMVWDVDAVRLGAVERRLLEILSAPYMVDDRAIVIEFGSGSALIGGSSDIDAALRQAEHRTVEAVAVQ